MSSHQSRKIRVRVAMTLEVDVDDWAAEYALDPQDIPALRADVSNYFIGSVSESPVGQYGGVTVVRT